jgi:hypothetical protein
VYLVLSAQASWPARSPAEPWSSQAVHYAAERQLEAWLGDRCAAGYLPEEGLREAWRARNARARQVAYPRVALWEPQLAEPSAPDVQAQPLEEAAAVAAVPLVQRRAGAEVPSALPVEVAAVERAAAQEAVPRAAEVQPEAPASLQAVGAEEVAEVEQVSLRAEAPEELVLLVAGRPSAAPSAFHPGRVLPWPARRPAARFAHAMQCSQIARQTARWWPAARGEVWS